MFKISQILKKLAKKYLNIIILAILFSMSCWANPKTLSSAESDDLVSINFYQTDIAIILQALADNKQMKGILFYKLLILVVRSRQIFLINRSKFGNIKVISIA
jgi:hypothetical protein